MLTADQKKAIKAALGLPADAGDDLVIETFRHQWLGDDGDPRQKMRIACERRAKEKNITFVEAMKEVQAEQPQLTEAVLDAWAAVR